MRKCCLLILLAAGTLMPALAQQPTPAPAESQDPDVVRITVRLVQVDGTVTDKDGRQVTDLTREDFKLFVDGREQQITNFAYIPGVGVAPAQATVAKAPKSEPNVPVPPAPPLHLRADQVRRTIALVVGNVSYDSMVSVKKALLKFVDERMQPGDLVAIIRLGETGVLQQFTSDKRLLHRAIDGARWNPLRGVGVSAAPNKETDSNNQIDEDAAKANTDAEDFYQDGLTNGWLQRLNLIVHGLEDLPGRKSILLFSDGFTLFGKDVGNQRTLESLHRLTDRAARALVVINTIDSRGLDTLFGGAAENTSLPPEIGTPLSTPPIFNGATFAMGRQNRVTEFLQAQDGLAALADATGGRFIQSTDLGGAITRMLDQKGYYLIGYRPDEATFKPQANLRPYHKIEVQLKRSELRSHFRKGFYGTPDQPKVAETKTSGQKLFAALTSPFDTSDIGVKLTSLFGHDKQDGSFVRSLLHINAGDLTFTEQADGRHKAVVNVFAATFDERGLVAEPVARTQTLLVRSEGLERLKRDGVVYEMTMSVTKTGIYQVRVAVEDAQGRRIGSASQFLEVPDIGNNRLTLSGIVISGNSPTKNQKTIAPQAAATGDETHSKGSDSQATTAVRKFHQGMRLDYACIIFNGRRDQAHQQFQLERQAVLYREGKAVYTGPWERIEPDKLVDFKQIVIRGALPLGPEYGPGEYVLQVNVTDKLADRNYRTATRWIDFDLID